MLVFPLGLWLLRLFRAYECECSPGKKAPVARGQETSSQRHRTIQSPAVLEALPGVMQGGVSMPYLGRPADLGIGRVNDLMSEHFEKVCFVGECMGSVPEPVEK